jgi:hypothetical protein
VGFFFQLVLVLFDAVVAWDKTGLAQFGLVRVVLEGYRYLFD